MTPHLAWCTGQDGLCEVDGNGAGEHVGKTRAVLTSVGLLDVAMVQFVEPNVATDPAQLRIELMDSPYADEDPIYARLSEDQALELARVLLHTLEDHGYAVRARAAVSS